MSERLYGDKTWKQINNDTLSSIAALCRTKGEEYKASDDDQLANFRRRAERLGLPMEAVWAVYAGKHWDALETYVVDLTNNFQRARAEPLEGRVDDIIVYLMLFKAMLAERNAKSYGINHDYCIDCDETRATPCDKPKCRHYGGIR